MYIINANLEGANFIGANLYGAYLVESNLTGANFKEANLQRTNLFMADLKGTNFEGANLKGILNLSIDQLSTARTLYNVKLDEGVLIQLKEEFPFLFKSLEQQFLENQSNLLGAISNNL